MNKRGTVLAARLTGEIYHFSPSVFCIVTVPVGVPVLCSEVCRLPLDTPCKILIFIT